MDDRGEAPDASVSVIIPVYDDLDRLLLCLDALERQTYPAALYDIWVVDNEPEPTIGQALNQYERVTCLHEPKPGSYAARNAGVAASGGEILAFTDSDCIPEPDWIEAGVRALGMDDAPEIIGGDIAIFAQDPDRPTTAEVFELIYGFSQEDSIARKGFVITANLMTSRLTFARVGPFADHLTSGGDMEWGHKARDMDVATAFIGEAKVNHPARRTVKQISDRHRRFLGGLHLSSVRQSDGSHLTRFARCLVPPINTAKEAYKNPIAKRFGRRLGVFWILYTLKWVKFTEGLRLARGGQPIRK